MKKIVFFTFLSLFVSFFTLQSQFVSAQPNNDEPWSKYPDNSSKEFKDVDSFYESLDKRIYCEFENAKLNIREKTYYKDVNQVLAKADKYVKSKVDGVGYHPNRQVYVFVTVSENGEKYIDAVFDADTGRQMFGGKNF